MECQEGITFRIARLLGWQLAFSGRASYILRVETNLYLGVCMNLPRISAPLLHAVVPAVLVALMANPVGAVAQSAATDHVVSTKALQQNLEGSSAARQKNVETLTRFMSTPAAEKAM